MGKEHVYDVYIEIFGIFLTFSSYCRNSARDDNGAFARDVIAFARDVIAFARDVNAFARNVKIAQGMQRIRKH